MRTREPLLKWWDIKSKTKNKKYVYLGSVIREVLFPQSLTSGLYSGSYPNQNWNMESVLAK